MKRIVVVNCSPRVGMNTGTLVREAGKGAEAEGAEVRVFDLYRLDNVHGCMSCFACKLAPNEGKCVYKDGLAEVLAAIREADGVIIGTPNYLGDASAGFHALYERLIFQSLTYKNEPRSYNERRIPILFIMTSNASEAAYLPLGYRKMLGDYEKTLEAFVGPVKVMISGDTLQVKDYSRFDWTMFDPAAKQKRHETVFPEEKKRAYSFGARMVRECRQGQGFFGNGQRSNDGELIGECNRTGKTVPPNRDVQRREEMKLSIIFEEKPKQWGFRGDPYFWDHLKERAEEMEIVSPDELEAWIKEEYLSVSGKVLTDEYMDFAVVKEFAHGGMSSGGVDNRWWMEKGIPLLKSRLTEL